MKTCLLITLIILSKVTLAQDSYLYKSNGKLIIDSTFSIDKNASLSLPIFEYQLLPTAFNNLKFPPSAKNKGIEGLVILKLTIAANSSQHQYSIVKTPDTIFNKAVLLAFNNASKTVTKQIGKNKEEIILFIPVNFKIKKRYFYQSVAKNHSLTLEENDIADQIFFKSYYPDVSPTKGKN